MPEMVAWVRDLMRGAKNGNADDIARSFTLFFQPVPPESMYEREVYYDYKFEPGHAEYDPVLRVLKAMVEDLVGKHIGVAGMKCNIFPTDNAPVTWPPSEAKSHMATKFYTIDDGGMFPMTMPASVFPSWPNYAPPTPDTLGSYIQNLPGVKDLQLRFRYLEEGWSTSP